MNHNFRPLWINKGFSKKNEQISNEEKQKNHLDLYRESIISIFPKKINNEDIYSNFDDDMEYLNNFLIKDDLEKINKYLNNEIEITKYKLQNIINYSSKIQKCKIDKDTNNLEIEKITTEIESLNNQLKTIQENKLNKIKFTPIEYNILDRLKLIPEEKKILEEKNKEILIELNMYEINQEESEENIKELENYLNFINENRNEYKIDGSIIIIPLKKNN